MYPRVDHFEQSAEVSIINQSGDRNDTKLYKLNWTLS